ncbi:MAG: aminoacyl-tRNA hydrolase [Omnitrophica bacterium RIFCSPLOWO2_01_FULL_50_24]|nr:MAG: aminoacyl-tRNA hydrolase [Omnitrophica bacterium RIFCSPLOWO2_01_FULL_50_24]
MKLIVGLGNPGKQYQWARHNTGFLVIDELLRHLDSSLEKEKHIFQYASVVFEGTDAILAKPMLMMNASGEAVLAMMKQFGVTPDDCLVVLDDINLPLGKIRFRPQGSSGGHKGLESIICALETHRIPRLRVGIHGAARSENDLSDYVLERFAREEQIVLNPELKRAGDACLKWISHSSESLMQEFN